MEVEIIIPSHLKKYANGSNRISAKPGKISEILKDINKRYPELSSKLTENGHLNPYFKLFLSNKDESGNSDVLHAESKVSGTITDYDMDIKPGQTLRVVLIISGG